MGKRKKASKPQGSKKKDPLPTTFQCLFCNHENSVTVKLFKKEGLGQLDCRICGQQYQSGINYLSAAVDVYTDWMDACEAVADKEGPEQLGGAMQMRGGVDPAQRQPRPRVETGGGEEDDLDGFIENDEDDAEAGYTGTMA